MAITTQDQFFSAASQTVRYRKANIGTSGSNANPMSFWAYGGTPASGSAAVGNTTTGVLFDDTITGAVPIADFGAGATGYIAKIKYNNSSASTIVMYDRLWGAGEISLLTSATTTFSGQPSITGRLPGGNDYGNLEIILELVTGASTGTAASVVVGYTNEAGVSGRQTDSVSINGTVPGGTVIGRTFRFSLQAGDKGVRQIDSAIVTAGALTTGGVNIILARRLFSCETRLANSFDYQSWDALGMPQVFDTSCLWAIAQGQTTTTGLPQFSIEIING